jgi:hypothetical protein
MSASTCPEAQPSLYRLAQVELLAGRRRRLVGVLLLPLLRSRNR